MNGIIPSFFFFTAFIQFVCVCCRWVALAMVGAFGSGRFKSNSKLPPMSLPIPLAPLGTGHSQEDDEYFEYSDDEGEGEGEFDSDGGGYDDSYAGGGGDDYDDDDGDRGREFQFPIAPPPVAVPVPLRAASMEAAAVLGMIAVAKVGTSHNI